MYNENSKQFFSKNEQQKRRDETNVRYELFRFMNDEAHFYPMPKFVLKTFKIILNQRQNTYFSAFALKFARHIWIQQ